jgi:hypothetical protein
MNCSLSAQQLYGVIYDGNLRWRADLLSFQELEEVQVPQIEQIFAFVYLILKVL